MRSDDFGAIIITHYQRLLDYLDVDYVHIIMNGQIVKSGGKELISKIDAEGYDWIKMELGIEDEEIVNKKAHAVLGSCAFKTTKE
jgi:Fe-S cluster assembly ATP-binding protein